jgi:hypothetical protein
MSSVGPTGRGPKQSAGGFFIPLGNVGNAVLQYTTVGGAGGSFQAGSFSTAAWAQGQTGASRFTSTISTVAAGGLLRDMGKTVVSAGRTFRKIQLITSTISTGGVTGAAAGGNPNVDYLTGYIELASGLNGINSAGGVPAPVAYYPGLM